MWENIEKTQIKKPWKINIILGFDKHCVCWSPSMRSGMWLVLNKHLMTTMNNYGTLEGLEQNYLLN